MHKLEKLWLIIGGGMLIVFLTVVGVNAFIQGSQPPGGHTMIDPEKVRQTAPFDKPGVKKIGKNEYEVVIVVSAFNYDFGPEKTLKFPQGAKVTYKLATTDVVHGFNVAGTNANVMVEPGYVSEVTVVHNQKGTFTMVCNEYCGVGHHLMFGTVEVM